MRPFDFPMRFGEESIQVLTVLHPVIPTSVGELRVLGEEDQVAGWVVREFVDPDKFSEFVSCDDFPDTVDLDHLLLSRKANVHGADETLLDQGHMIVHRCLLGSRRRENLEVYMWNVGPVFSLYGIRIHAELS
ncbi:hypothetical protein ACF07L_06765 [Streptomyces anulatus]|uniref:hypothetical protein n=1 Tax=Streptomyces anulatus TaxID=1892 RepID=UPI0036FAC17F